MKLIVEIGDDVGIVKTELKTFRIDYFCDECLTPIKAIYGDRGLIGTKWHHQCPKCLKWYKFDNDVEFPRIEYVDLKECKDGVG